MPSRPVEDYHPRRDSHQHHHTQDRDRQRETESNQPRSGAGGATAVASSRKSTSTRRSQDDEEDRIGPYLIGEEIGRGSFATVYRGERHVSLPPYSMTHCLQADTDLMI